MNDPDDTQEGGAGPSLEALRVAIAQVESAHPTGPSVPSVPSGAAGAAVPPGAAGAAGRHLAAVPGTRGSSPVDGAPTEGAGRPRRTGGDHRDGDDDPYARARAIVLRQLTGAPRTRAQLRTALVAKDCPADVADAVLDRMAEVGLVDDSAYAQTLVRTKQSTRGLARAALTHELRTKGVDEDTTAQVIAAIDPDDERRRARALVDKRLATLHGLDVAVQRRRLAGMLARKGYPGDLAWSVIRDAIADSPEHRRD